MKVIAALTRISMCSLVGFAAGLALDVGALAIFATAASSLVLLIVAADYGYQPRVGVTSPVLARRREKMPLAA